MDAGDARVGADASADGAGSSGSTVLPSGRRFVIFDLDGTLIDYEGQSHVGLAEGLRGAGLEPWVLTWELYNASIIGMRPESWSHKILTSLKVDLEAFSCQQYIQAYHDVMEGLYDRIQPMPGAEELVARLSASGARMAIATSSVRKSFDTKMTYHPKLLAPME
eukprot:CAMPEP_0168475510 /NCGR_PEP_ID=MMETSP0228-20121227/61398_1 /TAXON_ID=133427 /ORGANISM="Protoceratium reticulatum, Strain CCCM 535 (=CCMP 1889)" /LENGTH=163 /DNA_ID=CAMNT_0008491579 /DNA_START=135 /DNA_END=623 /DNA_ORIENTATION=+